MIAAEHRIPAPDKWVEEVEDEHTLFMLLDLLSPREQRSLELRFGLNDETPKTYREIGEELGITTARASKIVSNAMRRIRRSLYNRSIKPHLIINFIVKPRKEYFIYEKDIRCTWCSGTALAVYWNDDYEIWMKMRCPWCEGSGIDPLINRPKRTYPKFKRVGTYYDGDRKRAALKIF